MKLLVWLLATCVVGITSAFAVTYQQVDAAVDSVLARYTPGQKIEKLTALVPKIWSALLATTDARVTQILFLIRDVVNDQIDSTLSNLYTIDTSPIDIKEQRLFQVMNEYRATRWLSWLIINNKLNQAAQILADDMALLGYFDHVSPQWIGYVQRLNLVWYDFTYVSENLGQWNTTSDFIVELRSKSPAHEVNLFHVDAIDVWVGYDPTEHYRVAVYAKPS